MIVTKANIKEIDFLNGATIFIDKPLGFTSFQIVNGIRKKISKYINSKIKIGHAGTLDPLATGMLILCTGKDTKIIDSYQAQSNCTQDLFIRSIAHEFGHRLSNGAYLESLRREQIGEYSVDNAWQYEKFIECIDDLTQRSISSSVIDTNNL